MYNRNLAKVQKAMYELSNKGDLAASYEEIAKQSGVPRRTVARAINMLEEDGLIKRIHAKGRGITNLYQVEAV